jgi:hypothetical protein
MLKDYKGSCHIHTEYFDGSIPVSDVIKSAQDAGLDFVILKKEFVLMSNLLTVLQSGSCEVEKYKRTVKVHL